MNTFIYPNKIMTFIIRNNSDFVFMQEPCSYRSVQIELTDDQLERLRLNWIGKIGSDDFHEEISQCWIEPK